MAATDTHATREKLLEGMFSVRSVPMLYNEDQLPLQELRKSSVEKKNLWWWVSRGLTPRRIDWP
jgi:hypothetical protein